VTDRELNDLYFLSANQNIFSEGSNLGPIVALILVAGVALPVPVQRIHNCHNWYLRCHILAHIYDIVKCGYAGTIWKNWSTHIIDIAWGLLLPKVPYAVEICMVQIKQRIGNG
jgi:hypothetical protein